MTRSETVVDYKREALDVTVACRSQDKLGEGIFWSPDEQALYWVDVPMPSYIHCLDPSTGTHRKWPMTEMVMSMAARGDGTLLVASHHGLNIFDTRTGILKRILAPEADKLDNRSNDGATDAKGRFWYGTMCNNIAADATYYDLGRSTGALWKIEPDLTATKMWEGVGIANATAFSPDNRTFYFADTARETIFAWDFDLEHGGLSNQRIFANPKGLGYPDGACVDAEGYLWNARWDAACVIRFAPDGSIDRIIDIPASRPTCCAFGGANLDALYVSTSRLHLSPEDLAQYSDSGSVFVLSPGVTGLRRPNFKG
jgi:L-arabinonolactonase